MAYLHALDNTIHFEQHGGIWPSSVGDSCAETARAFVLGDPRIERDDLVTFIGPHGGYVRHPSLAELVGWDAADFTSDQALPLILGFDHKMPALYWRTAPSKLAAPGVMAAARNWWTLLGIINLIQAALFLIPYHYSDDERLSGFNRIVRTDDQYADYLNWFVVVYFLHKKGYTKLVRAMTQLVDRFELLRRVRGYYAPEPNSEWIVALYERASLEVYRD